MGSAKEESQNACQKVNGRSECQAEGQQGRAAGSATGASTEAAGKLDSWSARQPGS